MRSVPFYSAGPCLSSCKESPEKKSEFIQLKLPQVFSGLSLQLFKLLHNCVQRSLSLLITCCWGILGVLFYIANYTCYLPSYKSVQLAFWFSSWCRQTPPPVTRLYWLGRQKGDWPKHNLQTQHQQLCTRVRMKMLTSWMMVIGGFSAARYL